MEGGMKRKLIMFILATIFIAVSISRASKIDRMQKIVDVAIGKYHTLCLFEDGRILAFGDNENGELGLGEFFFRRKIRFSFLYTSPNKVCVNSIWLFPQPCSFRRWNFMGLGRQQQLSSNKFRKKFF